MARLICIQSFLMLLLFQSLKNQFWHHFHPSTVLISFTKERYANDMLATTQRSFSLVMNYPKCNYLSASFGLSRIIDIVEDSLVDICWERLISWLFACAVSLYAVLIMFCAHFPYGVWGRTWLYCFGSWSLPFHLFCRFISQNCTRVNIVTVSRLRNKFHFSEDNGSMNPRGHVQKKWRPKGVTFTLHGTRCVHTSMNFRKMKFISYIYTYLWNFDFNFTNKRRRTVIIRHVWLLRSTPVNMTWRQSNVTSASQLLHLSMTSHTRKVAWTSVVHGCKNLVGPN